MNFTKYQKCIGILLVFLSLSTLGSPLSGLGGESVEFPFGSCERYQLGGRRGFPILEEKSLKLEPMFVIYPMTNEPIAVAFHVTFPRAMFKINIQGTMITIKKCSQNGRQCQMENEEGVKHVDYIRAHQWNKVRLNMDSDKLDIFIGDRKVLSKSLDGYSMKSDEIFWQIISNDPKRKGSGTREPDFLYLVQFQCPEFEDSSNHPKLENKSTYHTFFAETTPTYESPPTIPYDGHKPHTIKPHDDHKSTSTPYFPREDENTHINSHTFHPVTEDYSSEKPYYEPSISESEDKESSEGVDYVGLIVGLVIAAIILITLFIVIYNVVKKRRSMSLTETSPLSTDQQQQETKH